MTAPEIEDRADSPEEQAIAAERHAQLQQLLASLPADQRDLLELRLAGLSAVEIGQTLGKSPEAVRKAQSRIVQTLRLEFNLDDTTTGGPVMTDPRDQAINQFWDDFVAGRQAPTDLDVHSAEAIAALHSLNTASMPESARERVRQRISSETNLKESKMSALTLAPPGSNGRVASTFMAATGRVVHAPLQQADYAGRRGSSVDPARQYRQLFHPRTGSGPLLRRWIGHCSGPHTGAAGNPRADWPMYRGNAGRTGVMPGTGPKIMPGEVWRVQLDGSAFRSPS